ncbi:MAG: anti-sigma factor family protein [Actinomycetota bacterium]
MSDSRSRQDEMRCVEFVDLISDYLQGDVSDEQLVRMEHHLEGCAGCRAALEQIKTVIRVTGRLTAADVASIDPLIRDRLLSTLRIPRRR